MLEKRKHKRMHVISYLKVQQRNTDQSFGKVVDLTTEGMGLYSEESIESNSICQFRVSIPTKSLEMRSIVFDARVMWCRKASHPGFYDSGIQLLNVPPKDLKLIEQFVENASLEDRWLSVDNTLAD